MTKTNIKFLKENNLYEAHKQFQRLCEWGYATSLHEAGEEDQEEDPSMGGAPDGDMNSDPSMGGAPDAGMGGDPSMGGAPDAGMGGDPSMGGAPDANMGGDPSMGGAPDASMGGDPSMEEDDDVISVDELTHAQEHMNKKVNSVGKTLEGFDEKMQQLFQALSVMQNMINNNNSKIEAFKNEFEKRNPTQSERLNLRSLDSAPFNEKPADYWNKKNMEGGYQIYSDNDEPTTKEWKITNDDVDHFDERAIQDSFNQVADEIQNLDLNRIFGY